MQLGNILELALTLLPPVSFKIRMFNGSGVDEFGQSVAEYGEWIDCVGMVQPVQRSSYEENGLDFAKNYINAWVSKKLFSVGLQKTPDQILWNGCLWNVTSVNEWNQYNGWVSVTAVQDKMYSKTTA